MIRLRFSRDHGRPLTRGETALARSIFGEALDPDAVRLHHAAWIPFQLPGYIMAPDGDIWFHPRGTAWSEDFAREGRSLQALLIHELTHCWQHQRGLFLPLRRHPFCRYRYTLEPGRPLVRYGIEQQAMIVQHAFEARVRGKPDARLELMLGEAGFCSQAAR